MNQRKELRELVDRYLIDTAGVSPERVNDSSLKVSELGIDSLGVVEMLFEIEDKYGFHIDDAMRFGGMTLDEVVSEIHSLIPAVQAKTADDTRSLVTARVDGEVAGNA